MLNPNKSSYRNIVKGTAIFGGVQVFQMLVNILRGKFIAILLGPEGMGVSALLTSTVNTINQVSSFGLSMGAVRDISMAHQEGSIKKLSTVATIFRRLVFITGILGALISAIGSKWWSELAFGNTDYVLAFVILGVMLFFTALSSGETAILQGTRHLKDLAKTSLIGTVVGLLVGVPMYYIWGVDGIAPAMVALALSTYLSNRFFTRKVELQKSEITNHETKTYAKSMIGLGVTLTFAGLLGSLTLYFINWFIRYNGGLNDVGLYQAATSITTQYIGFIFSAMAVDYFPRLAAISSDNVAVSKAANQQGEIVLLIATPIIILLLATAPLVINILLSVKFMAAIPLLRWMGMALFFKAASYSLGYISFAKGDKRTFFLLEGVVGNVLNVILSVVGYMFWGLDGLGVAMLITFLLYFISVSIVVKCRYAFKFDKTYIKMALLLLSSTLSVFLLSFVIVDNVWYGILGCIIGAGVGYYSFRELDKRMQIKELIKSKFVKR